MSAKAVPRIEKPLQTWAKDDLPPFTEEDAIYPESDGKPMADSTRQFDWIVRVKEGLELKYRDDPNVFVAGDHFWYPVEGRPDIRVAPDAMVIFGRPKGHRRSYRQWREDGIAPQVVFEIWSYSNRPGDRKLKLEFYDRYGVEEYYTYDPRPRKLVLEGWVRRGGGLVQLVAMDGWVSPRLGIRFQRVGKELNLYYPDGAPFLSFTELSRQRDAAQQQAVVEREAKMAAQRQALAERAAKEVAWAKLRALGIDPATL